MFKDIFDSHDWNSVKASIYAKTDSDVMNAINKSKLDLEDFKALISPAAQPFLEQMAQRSHRVTQKRFGKTMQMYVPLYLSNKCSNSCSYCGFNAGNAIKRKTLTDEEILREVEVIKSMGYDHVLLVTGEENRSAGLPYLKNAVRLLRPYFSNISMEVQPLEQSEYEELVQEGLYSVLLYQETFNKNNYPQYHPKGKKSDFYYRLGTHDRLGKAEVYKMGLGILIGLEDWRTDSFFVALHLDYLEKTYWKSKYSISFPRLRPFVGSFQPNVIMEDKELVQLICAYRIFNEEIELSLSTRESQKLRNNLLKLGVTSISAGSKTNPGGYSADPEALEQFAVSDDRSAKEMEELIKQCGYEPVWKDWDRAMNIVHSQE